MDGRERSRACHCRERVGPCTTPQPGSSFFIRFVLASHCPLSLNIVLHLFQVLCRRSLSELLNFICSSSAQLRKCSGLLASLTTTTHQDRMAATKRFGEPKRETPCLALALLLTRFTHVVTDLFGVAPPSGCYVDWPTPSIGRKIGSSHPKRTQKASGWGSSTPLMRAFACSKPPLPLLYPPLPVLYTALHGPALILGEEHQTDKQVGGQLERLSSHTAMVPPTIQSNVIF